MVTNEEYLEDPAIVAYLHRLIEDDGMELIRRFPDDEHSDEDLAEITGINLNSVRNSLYTLYERRLAKYRRIKNNETGWLTYLWQLQLFNVYEAIAHDMDIVLEKLKKRQKYEVENDFFICKDCGVILTFAQAFDIQFACPQCEKQMSHFDNEILATALTGRIHALEETLGHV